MNIPQKIKDYIITLPQKQKVTALEALMTFHNQVNGDMGKAGEFLSNLSRYQRDKWSPIISGYLESQGQKMIPTPANPVTAIQRIDQPQQGKPVTLTKEIVSNFLKCIYIEDQTKENYSQGLRHLRLYSEKNPTSWYTQAGLIDLIKYLRSQYDTSTVNTYLTPVRQFFKYLFDSGAIPYNPAANLKGFRPKKSTRLALSLAEVERLLQTVRESGNDTWFRDYVMIALIAHTGLREKSIQNLMIQDIDQYEHVRFLRVLIKGKETKDEVSILKDEVYDLISKLIGNRIEGYIFVGMGNRNQGGKLTCRTIRRQISDYMKIAGIKRDETKCVHSLRHFFIQEALKKNCELYRVQDAVHHRDPKTTRRYSEQLDRFNREKAPEFVIDIDMN